ncbi:MAG: type II secretion system F family protein [Lautropia sp.]
MSTIDPPTTLSQSVGGQAAIGSAPAFGSDASVVAPDAASFAGGVIGRVALASDAPSWASDWRLLVAAACVLVAIAFALHAVVGGGVVAGHRYRARFTGRVGRRLNDMLLFVDPARLFTVNLLAVALVLALVWFLTGSVLLAAGAVLALAAVPNWLLAHLGRRRRLRFCEQLPDVLMLVAGALRAGASLTLALRQMAIEIAAPAGQEFDLMLREQRLGSSLEQALGGLERRMGSDELRLFTAAIRIAGESGGNLAETLERLADAIRKRLEIEAKIKALTAQGRLQGWVMALLPIIVGAALFAIEPEAMEPLLVTWQGWTVVFIVLCLELAGLAMIRRIMDIDV